MKLYRHYKNKPYKVHGIAKHSETLEELVVYETLYDNPTAKLWVRPRRMFEEHVSVAGCDVARFAKVPLQIETFTEVNSKQVEVLAALIKESFGEWDPQWFHSNLGNHTRIHLLIASIDNKPVAFKLGYELDKWTFYSWLGGVLPEHRSIGIAEELITAQHDWCRGQGYRKVQTKTQNHWKAMLMLNIKMGFEIVGYHSSDHGGPKILLEKRIQEGVT